MGCVVLCAAYLPQVGGHGLFAGCQILLGDEVQLVLRDLVQIFPAGCYHRAHLGEALTDSQFLGGRQGAHKAYITVSGGVAYAPRKLRFVFNGENAATGVDQVSSDQVQSTKVLRDGQLIILRGDKEYNAQGQIVK